MCSQGKAVPLLFCSLHLSVTDDVMEVHKSERGGTVLLLKKAFSPDAVDLFIIIISTVFIKSLNK